MVFTYKIPTLCIYRIHYIKDRQTIPKSSFFIEKIYKYYQFTISKKFDFIY